MQDPPGNTRETEQGGEQGGEQDTSANRGREPERREGTGTTGRCGRQANEALVASVGRLGPHTGDTCHLYVRHRKQTALRRNTQQISRRDTPQRAQEEEILERDARPDA